MKNTGLKFVLNTTVDNFTTNFGMMVRRLLNKPLRLVLKLATKRKVIIETDENEKSYSESKEPYIFISTHSFDEDIVSSLANIDRSTYILMGTTDQIEHNPKSYAAFLNGMVYVDRNSEKSRKDSLLKMQRVLDNGSSVLIFAEGGWNNSENLLVLPLFSSPYILNQATHCKVVPMCSFNEPGDDKIYMKFGSPMSFDNMTKEEALIKLRDNMATMTYEMIEKHSKPLKRSELSINYHLEYAKIRHDEYFANNTKWSEDPKIWEEEVSVRKDKNNPLPQDVRKSLEKVKITKANFPVMIKVLNGINIDKQVDFMDYMKHNYRK